MSDYYNYYNQKYELPKANKSINETSSQTIVEAYKNGIRVFRNIDIENGSFFGENLEGILIENSEKQIFGHIGINLHAIGNHILQITIASENDEGSNTFLTHYFNCFNHLV